MDLGFHTFTLGANHHHHHVVEWSRDCEARVVSAAEL